MMDHDKVNILLVDDQPAKLLAYEVILKELGENLIKASSGREALEYLLKNDVAVILVDVCMPELDGFELAAMIREHPRFQKTAMIFISAIQLSDIDRLRGYEMGAVDYVPVPVVPEVLRAKVKVFAELYRKTRQLERLNAELEDRVRARTAELEASHRTAAAKASSAAAWRSPPARWARGTGTGSTATGCGTKASTGSSASIPTSFERDAGERPGAAPSRRLDELRKAWAQLRQGREVVPGRIPHRPARRRGALVRRHGGGDHRQGRPRRPRQRRHRRHHRAQAGRGAPDPAGARGRPPRQERAGAGAIDRAADARRERRRPMSSSVEGRIKALARVHTVLSLSRWQGAEISRLVDEELAPYSDRRPDRAVAARRFSCEPATAQTLALALHELVTNAAKYGALSALSGRLSVQLGRRRTGFSSSSGWRPAGRRSRSRHRAGSEPEA